MREHDHRAAGASADAARTAARREFGHVTLATERAREMWMFPLLESVRQDLRYGLRLLRRAPGFSVLAIIVLAAGIAGNTTIFSLMDAVRLRAVPYADPDRLVLLWGDVLRAQRERRGASYPDFLDWRAQASSFDAMAAVDNTRMTVSGAGEAQRVAVETVSAAYFSILGRQPALGRTFRPDEDVVPQKVAVAILADGFWKRTFGADPAIVGRSIVLDGRPYEVVGVMPAGFRGSTDSANLWIPFVMSGTTADLANRGARGFGVVARLKPAVSIAAAQADLDAISRRLEQTYPDTNEKRGVEVARLDEELLGGYRPALRLLMVAIALVLLIGCANIANLQLARAEARRREVALRTAIGASRARIVRQLVTESGVLVAIAVILGLAGTWWALAALQQYAPIAFPSFVQPRLNVRGAAFAVAVAAACVVLLGLAPACFGGVSRVADVLKDSVRGGTRAGGRVRAALIVAETALAVVLLVGAALMLRSVQRLLAIDAGFDPRGVLTLRVSVPLASEDEQAGGRVLTGPGRVLLERVRALPGVTAASLASDPPLSGLSSAVFYTAEGQPVVNAQNVPRAYVHRVTPDFFRTLAIRMATGRTFTPAEATSPSAAVIVSEGVTQRFWPGQDAVGKRIKLGTTASTNPWLTIVGVVREVKYRGLPQNPTADPDLYFPFLDRAQQFSLVLRSASDPAALAAAVRGAVHEVSPEIPIFAVATLEESIAEQTASSRFTTWVMSGFGGFAWLLASLGIYGVMSYLVTQRTREIGIRVALGATRREIVRVIVGGGARQIGLGIALGVLASAAVHRVMRSLLFEVTLWDPAAGAAIAALGLTGLVACYLPARRASHVNPLRALRDE